jgi:hypothetical protein
LERQWPKWRTTFANNDKGFLEVLVEVSLVDGTEIYLHALGRSPMSLDALLEPEHAIVARSAPNGTAFINPRNVVRARIYHSENKVNYQSSCMGYRLQVQKSDGKNMERNAGEK